MDNLAREVAVKLEALVKRGAHVTGVRQLHPARRITSGLQRTDSSSSPPGLRSERRHFSLSLAYNVARQGQAVAFFSLEMSAEQILFRLLSMASGIDLQQLRTGRLSKSRQAEAAMKIDELSKLPLFIDDSPVQTVLDLGAKLRRLRVQRELHLVVIDYLQLMRGVGPPRTGTRRYRPFPGDSRPWRRISTFQWSHFPSFHEPWKSAAKGKGTPPFGPERLGLPGAGCRRRPLPPQEHTSAK